jgi:hypothetical protein
MMMVSFSTITDALLKTEPSSPTSPLVCDQLKPSGISIFDRLYGKILRCRKFDNNGNIFVILGKLIVADICEALPAALKIPGSSLPVWRICQAAVMSPQMFRRAR